MMVEPWSNRIIALRRRDNRKLIYTFLTIQGPSKKVAISKSLQEASLASSLIWNL